MRVVTFNIRHARPRRGFASTRRLREAIAALDADVVALQEVDRRIIRSWFADQAKVAARALGTDAYRYAPARRFLVTGSDGVALCVRGTIIDSRTVPLGRDAGQARVALVATVVVDGCTFTMVTTHLQNESSAARAQLDEVLTVMAGSASPRLLLGDLNLRPDDIDGALTAAGFVVAGGPPTEPSDAPAQRIDHVAVDGFTIVAVSAPRAAISDHRPLVVELAQLVVANDFAS